MSILKCHQLGWEYVTAEVDNTYIAVKRYHTETRWKKWNIIRNCHIHWSKHKLGTSSNCILINSTAKLDFFLYTKPTTWKCQQHSSHPFCFFLFLITSVSWYSAAAAAAAAAVETSVGWVPGWMKPWYIDWYWYHRPNQTGMIRGSNTSLIPRLYKSQHSGILFLHPIQHFHPTKED